MREEVTYRVGIPVFGLRGEPLGRVEKVLFSESRHQVTGVVVRSLDSLHLVPLDRVTAVSAAEIRTSMTEQDLHAADVTQASISLHLQHPTG